MFFFFFFPQGNWLRQENPKSLRRIEKETEERSRGKGRVAQRIRARGYEPRSRGFKSLLARQFLAYIDPSFSILTTNLTIFILNLSMKKQFENCVREDKEIRYELWRGPGAELSSQRAPPAVLSPQQSFTAKFGMDWRVSSAPRAPGLKYILSIWAVRVNPISLFSFPSFSFGWIPRKEIKNVQEKGAIADGSLTSKTIYNSLLRCYL